MERASWYQVGGAAIVGALVVGVAIPRMSDADQAPLLSWFAVMALLALSILAFGRGVTGRWIGAAIDDRRKLSISRTQMACWTVLIVGSIFAAATANLARGADRPLDVDVPQEAWVLVGISWFSFAGSQLIKKTQSESGALGVNQSAQEAQLSDIVSAERSGQEGTLDLGKIQMLMLSAVVVVTYAAGIADQLTSTDAIRSLPAISDGMVALLAISHAGYLTYKGLPSPAAGGAAAPARPGAGSELAERASAATAGAGAQAHEDPAEAR